VVDDLARAQAAHQVELGGARHTGDLGALGHRELDREAADPAGRADDQHPLAGADAAGAQGLQRGERRDGRDRRLLVRRRGGLGGELGLAGHGVLRERARPDPEHLVAGGEAGDPGADLDDRARELAARHRLAWPAQPGDQAHEVGRAGHQVPRPAVDAGGVHADQDLAVTGRGDGQIGDAEHVGVAVRVLGERLHGAGESLRGHVRSSESG
jgi:hypothetical protein